MSAVTQAILISTTPAASGVQFDAAANAGDLSGLTTADWEHTCSGTNRYLVVGLAGFDSEDGISGVTITYNGDAMTNLGGEQAANTDFASLWGLVAPDTGTHDIVVSNIPAAIAELGGGSVSFTGVDQITPTGTLTSAQAATTDITLADGDLGVDILYDGQFGTALDYPTPGAGETTRVNNTFLKNAGSDRDYMMMGTEAGSGTVTMSWTGHGDNGIAAVPIKAA